MNKGILLKYALKGYAAFQENIVEELVDNEDPQADKAVKELKVFVNEYQI